MQFKDQMRIAREAAGFSQVELAKRLDVSRQSIVWWEDGTHRPKSARIRQIEEVLNIRLDISERGNAMALDKNNVSLSADPEMLRLAVAIGRLPKAHREAIKTLIFIREATTIGK